MSGQASAGAAPPTATGETAADEIEEKAAALERLAAYWERKADRKALGALGDRVREALSAKRGHPFTKEEVDLVVKTMDAAIGEDDEEELPPGDHEVCRGKLVREWISVTKTYEYLDIGGIRSFDISEEGEPEERDDDVVVIWAATPEPVVVSPDESPARLRAMAARLREVGTLLDLGGWLGRALHLGSGPEAGDG
jgi:hypothetical protein